LLPNAKARQRQFDFHSLGFLGFAAADQHQSIHVRHLQNLNVFESSGTEFLYSLARSISHWTAFERSSLWASITSRTRLMCSGFTVTISSTAFSPCGFVGRPRFFGDGFMVF
jgi:hypothetical protein